MKLFRRLNKALRLTDAGQACLPRLQAGFDNLAEAVESARATEESRPVTVTMPPSFGAKWLVPRLDRFSERPSRGKHAGGGEQLGVGFERRRRPCSGIGAT